MTQYDRVSRNQHAIDDEEEVIIRTGRESKWFYYANANFMAVYDLVITLNHLPTKYTGIDLWGQFYWISTPEVKISILKTIVLLDERERLKNLFKTFTLMDAKKLS